MLGLQTIHREVPLQFPEERFWCNEPYQKGSAFLQLSARRLLKEIRHITVDRQTKWILFLPITVTSEYV